MLEGGDGDDKLYGRGGADTLDGGADHFQVRSIQDGAASKHTIEDFVPGEDKITFSAGGVGWEDLEIVQEQDGAVVSGFTLDAGDAPVREDTITLTGVDAAALTAADFGLDG